MMGLQAASGLVTFLLQTAVEWCVCVLLVRIIRSPRVRFRVWLGMFSAYFVQWIWMWAGILGSSPLRNVSAVSEGVAVRSAGQSLALSSLWVDKISWILPLLAVSYGVVLFWILVRAALRRVRLAKALQYKAAPSERLSRIFHSVRLRFPLHGCRMWVLPGVASPATLGWWRSQIVIPAVCETHEDADLETVFLHELIHVQRRDALWNALVRGCRNLLWFHPCVHHAFAAICAERELACDAAVVEEHAQSRDAYATCLVRFARLSSSTETANPCIELTSAAAFLNLRVRSILTEPPVATRRSSLFRTAVSVLLLAVTTVLIPDLRILLTMARPNFVAVSSVLQEPPAAATRGKRQRFRVKEKILAAVPSSSVSSGGDTIAQTISPPDPQLAAAHRVGMGVLTQYTEVSEDAAARQAGSSGTDLGSPAGHSSAGQPSWTTVALGAAERLGSIDLDHDHDRH